MTDRPLNFAVIGCGMLARSQHIPNIAASDKTVLHTCCDLSDDALSECSDVVPSGIPALQLNDLRRELRNLG